MTPEFAWPTWVDHSDANKTWRDVRYEVLLAFYPTQIGYQWFGVSCGSGCWGNDGHGWYAIAKNNSGTGVSKTGGSEIEP